MDARKVLSLAIDLELRASEGSPRLQKLFRALSAQDAAHAGRLGSILRDL